MIFTWKTKDEKAEQLERSRRKGSRDNRTTISRFTHASNTADSYDVAGYGGTAGILATPTKVPLRSGKKAPAGGFTHWPTEPEMSPTIYSNSSWLLMIHIVFLEFENSEHLRTYFSYLLAGMELRVGSKYRLGRKIGSGSFGDIYLGESACLNQYWLIRRDNVFVCLGGWGLPLWSQFLVFGSELNLTFDSYESFFLRLE